MALSLFREEVELTELECFYHFKNNHNLKNIISDFIKLITSIVFIVFIFRIDIFAEMFIVVFAEKYDPPTRLFHEAGVLQNETVQLSEGKLIL